MELKLAPTEINKAPKKIGLNEIYKLTQTNQKRLSVFYFSRDNIHKDFQKTKTFLESKGKTFYLSEIRYGPNPRDMVYECHIL